MAGRNVVRVEGADRLIRTLKDAGADLDDLRRLHAAVGGLVERSADSRVPHGETGNLAGSIRSSGTGNAAYIRAGKSSVPYAGVQEFGWSARHIPASPFMFPAVRDNEARILDEYADAVDRVLATVKGD